MITASFANSLGWNWNGPPKLIQLRWPKTDTPIPGTNTRNRPTNAATSRNGALRRMAGTEAREITTIAVSPTPANMSCFWVTVSPTSAPAAYVTTLLAEKTITIPSTSSSIVVLSSRA